MPRDSRTFWLARRGNSPAEYEDASAADEAAGRYAVADGATEGCFTGLWARLLVEDFMHADGGASQWPKSLSAVQGQWDAEVRGRKLPWHASPWVERGAYATFLGLTIADGKPDGTNSCEAPEGLLQQIGPVPFSAVAVGDTCVFHTRNDVLLRAFPLEHSEQFGNSPKLVGARMSLEQIRENRDLWPDGRGRPGDRLWVMTDALAQWCLAEHEMGENPWSELELLFALPASSDGFAAWAEGLRSAGRLRNDDVTLLTIPLKE